MPSEARELSDDQLLEQLNEHPAYPVALERLKERMEKHFHRLGVRLSSGEDIPATEIEWLRGYYACLKNLLDEPLKAVVRLKKERDDE